MSWYNYALNIIARGSLGWVLIFVQRLTMQSVEEAKEASVYSSGTSSEAALLSNLSISNNQQTGSVFCV